MQVGDRVRTDLIEGAEELEVVDVEPGIQLRGEPGSRVRALRAGAVEAAAVASTGTEVVVAGDDGHTYFYGNVDNLVAHVTQRVTAGRTLGELGASGVLHFGVDGWDGQVLNPVPFLTLPEELAPPEIVNAGADPGFAPPPGVDSVVSPPVPPAEQSASGLLPSHDDMADVLRRAGWSVDPPALPTPIPGGGNPG